MRALYGNRIYARILQYNIEYIYTYCALVSFVLLARSHGYGYPVRHIIRTGRACLTVNLDRRTRLYLRVIHANLWCVQRVLDASEHTRIIILYYCKIINCCLMSKCDMDQWRRSYRDGHCVLPYYTQRSES